MVSAIRHPYFLLHAMISGVICLVLLLTPNAFLAKEFPEFDSVAGFPGTMTFDTSDIARIESLERKKLTLTVNCLGNSIEKHSYVRQGSISFVLEPEKMKKAGSCSFTICDPEGKTVLSGGSFEIFPDVPVRQELQVKNNEALVEGIPSELLGGFFDRFDNPTTTRMVLMSDDGMVKVSDTENGDGYMHFFFTPNHAGDVDLTLVDSLSGESRQYLFVVNATHPVAEDQENALPIGDRDNDTAAQFLQELLRLNLADGFVKSMFAVSGKHSDREYVTNVSEVIPEPPRQRQRVKREEMAMGGDAVLIAPETSLQSGDIIPEILPETPQTVVMPQTGIPSSQTIILLLEICLGILLGILVFRSLTLRVFFNHF